MVLELELELDWEEVVQGLVQVRDLVQGLALHPAPPALVLVLVQDLEEVDQKQVHLLVLMLDLVQEVGVVVMVVEEEEGEVEAVDVEVEVEEGLVRVQAKEVDMGLVMEVVVIENKQISSFS